MTGRDLIIHILQNNLEDQEVFKDGKLIGFMTDEEAAVKFNVGVATVRVWVSMNIIDSINIGNHIFIPINEKYPVLEHMQNMSNPSVDDLYNAFMDVMRGSDV